eukprot:1154523-Pelagomonas_calceolata.AAC.3
MKIEIKEELGLDYQRATKLAQQLHAHSVQYAHKLVFTRRATENKSTAWYGYIHAATAAPRPQYACKLACTRRALLSRLPSTLITENRQGGIHAAPALLGYPIGPPGRHKLVAVGY